MPNRIVESCKTQWAFGLWIIIFVVVMVFGLWGHSLVASYGYHWNFWHRWEVGALASAIVFNALFYAIGFFIPPRMFNNLPSTAVGLVPIFEIVLIVSLLLATWASLSEKSCLFQLLCLLVAALCFFGIDLLMARHCLDPRVKQDFRASLTLNDTPVILAFVVLLLFAWVYPNSGEAQAGGGYDVPFRSFLGGAIAFQLIISSWVLALIFRKPGEGHDDKTPEDQ